MQLPELLKNITQESVPNLSILALVSDSRDATAGCLFVALAGYGGPHGLLFAQQAVQQGAIAVLWEPADNAPELPDFAGVFVLAVPNLQQQLGLLSARFYGNPSNNLSVVGITGTDGKTSCAWLLVQAWQALGQRAAMIGTLGKGEPGALRRGSFTTPFPLELQAELADFKKDHVSHVAMEVSSHALEQSRVAAVHFDVAVLTNLGRDHLDYHGSLEAYQASKKLLFTRCQPRIAVVNADDEFGERLIAEQGTDELISYGLGPATLQALNINQQGGLSFTLRYAGNDYAIATKLLGDFNVYNLLAVLATLLAQGFSVEQSAAALTHLQAPPGRLERFSSGAAQVVVDYAHTADALTATLKTLRSATPARLLCVMGCGGDRDRGKRALMASAAERYADWVCVTDDNPRSESPDAIFSDIRSGFTEPDAVLWQHDRAAAIAAAVAEMREGDTVLVAGKGHEDYQLLGDERRYFSDRAVVSELLKLPAPEALYA